MATNHLAAVKAVLAAIQSRDTDAALKHVDPSFIQHHPYMAGGLDGLRRYIDDSTPEELNLKIVRFIEDGDYVLAQLSSASAGQDIFVVYRFANDLIAEHWAFFSPAGPPNKSGHTQLDGPTEPHHLDETEKNKSFLRYYYQTFHLSGDHSQNERFFTGDFMIRHEPGVRDGLGEFLQDVEELMKHRTIDEIKLLLGEGDLVFIAAQGTHEGRACAYIDLYRVDDLKVVEHWGFPQPIPPQADGKNAGDLF